MEQTIYYKDNPNLGHAVVKTNSGETEYRRNCRKIKGAFFVMNKDCFEVGSTWYRLSSGLIDKDWETGKWFLKDKMPPDMVKGVVGFIGGVPQNPIMGFFTANPYKNTQVALPQGGVYTAISEEMLLANGFGEHFATGMWMHLSKVSVSSLQRFRNEVNFTNKGYNIEDNAKEYADKIKLYDAYKLELSKDVRSYGRMLGDTSFGIEIECAHGYIPPHVQNRHGIVICRDGSLNDENGTPGPEYVTIPLKGAKGLQNISHISKEISKRNDLSLKCSLHIHLGGLPQSRLFLVSLFRLCHKIQDELFLMFPYYKTNPDGIKSKNYNQKLPLLGIVAIPPEASKEEFAMWVNSSYKKIAAWLGEGYQPDSAHNRKQGNHPVNQKWNRSKRYYWMNAMNMVWSKRQTIEFRPHTPTTNSQKIINWLFICNAIVKYAETHYRKILTVKTKNITFDEVLSYYADNFGKRGQLLSEYLKAYVKERSEAFMKDYEKGDHLSQWEMDGDRSYQFKHGNVTHLF